VQVEIHSSLTFVERRALTPMGLLKLLCTMPLSVAQILRLIRKHRVDLVHTNTALILSPAIAARLSGRPHLWHIREFFSEFPRLWRLHRRVMARMADIVVAVSEAVGAQFEEPMRSRKVRVVHNGLPHSEFEGVSVGRAEAFRRQFGVNGGPAVGLVGRIKLRRKGQDVFVKAVAQVTGRFPEARFLIIGSPFPGNEDHLEQLQRMIGELGVGDRVLCTGDVGDIKAAYGALDVTVLPTTLPEPFGGVVVESMAMGKPVIATRLGGSVEQVEDGVSGLLVTPDDPAALADAMARLLSDPQLRAEMGARAKERFLKCFEFEPFYAQITQLYSELIRS
jgi:glycosyltransferase involved in cell wall biosynthesis